ncbi:MAG: bifunctional oligoribonuclease/PAP phosphatase NrnA [Oscillospiraceae bacterium]|jgi:phosphoesterase RecJ-like protein|nr:bifunctional oligoribonuclease/PAP phosphatase NrnA [Oscillospiraceae bacterium]
MTIREAARLLAGLDCIYLLTHQRPDGDTLGSAAGLCAGLRALGKTAFVLPNPDITPRYRPYAAPYLADSQAPPEGAVLVSVDVAAPTLLPPGYRPLAGEVTLSVDHHPTNPRFARNNLVMPGRAATGEIIFSLLRALGVPLSRDIALPLYLAVSTDTGCFRYTNTTAFTHRVAAALLATGIDCDALHTEMFESKSRARLKVEALLIDNMAFYQNGAVALGCLTAAELTALGAAEDDVDNISALSRQIEGVEIGAVLREVSASVCKLSVRTSTKWEANRLCALLGGGGHERAAGAKVPGGMETAKQAVLQAFKTYLGVDEL